MNKFDNNILKLLQNPSQGQQVQYSIIGTQYWLCFQVEGESFRLHKGLLIALSPYFQSMFTSGFEEASKSHVELKGVTPAGFMSVTQFLYTSEITICENSLQDIMEAAAHLQIPGVLNFCGEFIAAHMSSSNCFFFFKLAHVYDHMPSLQAIVEFITRNCHIMCEKTEFHSLPADMLAQVLDGEHLPFKSEVEVLKVATRWLANNPDCDMLSALKVFESVRYALINPVDVEKCMVKCRLWNKPEFQELLSRAYAYKTDPVNLPCQVPKAQYRQAQYGGSGVMLVHDSVHDVETDLITGRVTLGKMSPWQFETCETLDSLPGQVIFKSAAIASMAGFVFVTGGELEPRPFQGFHASNKTHRYDFLSKSWVEVGSMCEARGMHGMAVLGEDRLLVLGGLIHHDGLPRRITASVEIYDLKTNKWTRMQDFPYAVRNIVACPLHGQVYVAGGTSEVQAMVNFHSQRLYVYDAEKDMWHERSSMHCKKIGHVMLPCGDKLFAAGGYLEIQLLFDIQHEPLTSGLVEYYTPDTNQWTIVGSPLNFRRELLGGFVINGRNCIYLLGHNHLVELNTDTNNWRLREVDSSSVGLCVTVQVPNAVSDAYKTSGGHLLKEEEVSDENDVSREEEEEEPPLIPADHPVIIDT